MGTATGSNPTNDTSSAGGVERDLFGDEADHVARPTHDEDQPDTNGNGWFDAEKSASAAKDDCMCSSADATLELALGATLTMVNLSAGDMVRVALDDGPALFFPVYLFHHKVPPSADAHTYVTSTTAAEGVLTLTQGCNVEADGVCTAVGAFTVGQVRTLASCAPSTVTAVSSVVTRGGVYNLHTLDGLVMASRILTSTYTFTLHPTVAEGLLVPPHAAWWLGMCHVAGGCLHGALRRRKRSHWRWATPPPRSLADGTASAAGAVCGGRWLVTRRRWGERQWSG